MRSRLYRRGADGKVDTFVKRGGEYVCEEPRPPRSPAEEAQAERAAVAVVARMRAMTAEDRATRFARLVVRPVRPALPLARRPRGVRHRRAFRRARRAATRDRGGGDTDPPPSPAAPAERAAGVIPRAPNARRHHTGSDARPDLSDLLNALIDGIAQRVAERLRERAPAVPEASTGRPTTFTYREAAEMAGVSPDRLRRAAAAHELEVIRFGPSSVRISPGALRSWIARHVVPAADDRVVPLRRRRTGGGR
jgi:excisionase family DNA binding protein